MLVAECVSIEEAGRADVYCLTVPTTAAFAIEGGLIVHNCADALRYGCMSRPYVRPAPEAKKPRWGLDLSFNELRDRAAKKRRAMED